MHVNRSSRRVDSHGWREENDTWAATLCLCLRKTWRQCKRWLGSREGRREIPLKPLRNTLSVAQRVRVQIQIPAQVQVRIQIRIQARVQRKSPAEDTSQSRGAILAERDQEDDMTRGTRRTSVLGEQGDIQKLYIGRYPPPSRREEFMGGARERYNASDHHTLSP